MLQTIGIVDSRAEKGVLNFNKFQNQKVKPFDGTTRQKLSAPEIASDSARWWGRAGGYLASCVRESPHKNIGGGSIKWLLLWNKKKLWGNHFTN